MSALIKRDTFSAMKSTALISLGLILVSLWTVVAQAQDVDCKETDNPRCASSKTDPEPTADETVKAEPWGIDVKDMPPTWCDTVELKNAMSPNSAYSGREVSRALGRSMDMDYKYDVTNLAYASCFAPSKPSRQRWVTISLQRISNFSGLSMGTMEAELAFSLMRDEAQKKEIARACERWLGEKHDTVSRKVLRASVLLELGCKLEKNERSIAELDVALAGRTPEFGSEIEKAVFLKDCLSVQRQNEDGNWLKANRNLGSFMGCGQDVSGLDRARLEKEMSELKCGLSERIALGHAHGEALRTGLRLSLGYKALAAKDADFQKAMFDAPARGFKEWVSTFDARKKDIAAALEFETRYADNFERKSSLEKAFASCAPDARKAWLGYVKSRKPKTAVEVMSAGTDAVGAPLLSALVGCEQGAKHFAIAAALKRLLGDQNPALLTPRHAAFAKGALEMAALRADRKNFVEQPVSHLRQFDWVSQLMTDLPPQPSNLAFGNGDWTRVDPTVDRQRSFDGVVSSVQIKKDIALVNFKSESWSEAVFNCKPTNRVERIDYSGSSAEVIYAQNCTPAGTETRRARLASIQMPVEYLGGIKAGIRLRIFVAQSPESKDAFLWGLGLEGFADPARKKLVHAIGLAL
jgi:hypothetical protein